MLFFSFNFIILTIEIYLFVFSFSFLFCSRKSSWLLQTVMYKLFSSSSFSPLFFELITIYYELSNSHHFISNYFYLTASRKQKTNLSITLYFLFVHNTIIEVDQIAIIIFWPQHNLSNRKKRTRRFFGKIIEIFFFIV